MRLRVVLVVAAAVAAAVLAAAVVLVVEHHGSSPAASRSKPLSGSPPLVLRLPKPSRSTTTAGELDAAEHELPAGDVRIAVGRAVAQYRSAGAAATIRRLKALDQASPVVVFHLALAQLWSGDAAAATTSLETVKRLDPYGFYGTRADNMLHIRTILPGYPPYFAPEPLTSSVAQLRRQARLHPGSSDAWLALAAALERTDRRAALAAARRALADAPTTVSPRVAVAVIGFDKDHLDRSFGQLGPMLQAAPDNPEIRFHLGLLAFWIQQDDKARGEWDQVVKSDPDSRYGRLAAAFSSCIARLQAGKTCVGSS